MDSMILMFGNIEVEVNHTVKHRPKADEMIHEKEMVDEPEQEKKKEETVSTFKLNPLAREFYPEEFYNSMDRDCNAMDLELANAAPFYPRNRRVRKSRRQRRTTHLTVRVEDTEKIKRTIYVSNVDPIVSEDQVAKFFQENCGEVIQCRICNKQRSLLRFAFVEFVTKESAEKAINFSGTQFGSTTFKVVASATSIAPVNPIFMPKSEEEENLRERTLYCSNIDRRISQSCLTEFFNTNFGEVSRMRLLGDAIHSTRTAFVEFVEAETAKMALESNGRFLGSLPLRVSPSKTQVWMKAALYDEYDNMF